MVVRQNRYYFVDAYIGCRPVRLERISISKPWISEFEYGLYRIFPNHNDIRRIKYCSNLNAFLGSPDTLTETPASYLPRFQVVEMGYEDRNAYRRLKTELIIYRLFLNGELPARFSLFDD